MDGKYKISKKCIKVLDTLSFKTKDDVFEEIKNLDIFPPFVVTDTSVNKDVTQEIMDYIEKKDFVFIEKEKILSKIPNELKVLLSKNGDELFFVYQNENVKLSNSFYIKNIMGFYSLWKNEYIAFGYQGSKVLFISPNETEIPVYYINYDSISDVSKKVLIATSYKKFISELNPRKK